MPAVATSSIPLYQFLRVGFPQKNNTRGNESFIFEYVGPEESLIAPQGGDLWGDAPWRVDSASVERVGLSGYVILRVNASTKGESESVTFGRETDTSYELEWTPIRRPLFEHPGFNTGGSNPLTFEDQIDIEYWKSAEWADKRVYKFRDEDGTLRTLSTNAQRYARYVARNVEGYDDYAPIARRVKTFSGGPPPSADAGTKTDLWTAFPNKPDGTWEWVKTADRGLRSAGQRDWQQNEDLTGATKVLLDNKNLYLA